MYKRVICVIRRKNHIFYVFHNKSIEIMRILKKVYKSIKIGWILLTGKQKV